MAVKPSPRKCETVGCEEPPRPVDWHPEAIDQTDGKRSAWVWECPCGWRRVEMARASNGVEKPEVDTQAA